MALSTFTHQAHEIIKELLESNKEFKRYALGVSAAILLSGSWYGYRHYKQVKESSAQEALIQCMSMHEKAVSGDVQWSDVASMSAVSLEQYRSTKAAPYLMACRVDALREAGEYDAALLQSRDMISALSKSNPLYALYQIKDALLNLDYGDELAQQDAIAMLTNIGSDSKNAVADRALYYLGSYQESSGEHEKARETWQQLVDLGSHEDRFLQSPYIPLVQSKL